MKEQEIDAPFPLRAYPKAELALLYSPGLCVTPALQKLYRWIRKNEELTAALREVGYDKYRHTFLRREVELIVKFLGIP
ncbi:DUF4248 domain-containing protein [uncultured Bacteroides sp.]|uniref:DUF4248 domain-containing protein n=1 Tax=uncultured Bacteroides sp. TaxID=162156 RepID=UPI002AA600A1|nr:DUF4248 domain-containing protein [uncultured Bacteroides sp.]